MGQMLLQTNSYIVPRQQRAEHARLLGRFRTALRRVGCDLFEVYEQTDANWSPMETDGRFVQIIRFRDREHQQAVRQAERMDLEAQSLIQEFCRLINFPYQQEHGLFAVGFYTELRSEGSVPPSDADLASVLDGGLVFDELDVPMEAELLDEDAPEESIHPDSSDAAARPLRDR
jgi:hypothetical protein